MTKSLFTYVIPHDHGFAPNPFTGFCTLATCKPVIRRSAQPGDWVVATGSLAGKSPGKLIYAMSVAEVLSLEKYDQDLRFEVKKPAWRDEEWRRLGDNIYFKSHGEWRQRRSLHGPAEMTRDLGGRYVLVAEEFYYFGQNAVELPADLGWIVKKGPGHRRIQDAATIVRLATWLRHSFEIGIRGLPSTLPKKRRVKLRDL